MKPEPSPPETPTPPAMPRWVETLHDRSQVLIRPLEPQDRAAEAEFLAGLSLQARRYGLLGRVASPSESLVEELAGIDEVHDVAFVAVVPEDAHVRIVGMARYRLGADPSGCECAVTVAEAWQDRGLGTILMKHLIALARARGIRTMVSIDAVDNLEMLELARHLGFHTALDPKDATLYVHRLELEPEAPPAGVG